MLRRGAAVVLAPLVALGGFGLLARAGGSPPARLDLRAGGAWVASTVGLMTLIDGSSAQVVARVDVGDASSGLTAVQAGAVGYAVDGERGTVVRIDPRTYAPGPPTRVVTGASGDVVARATRQSVYVLDEGRGRVAVADADDLAKRRGDEVSVADGVRSSVVDSDGRLWLLGETTGDLVWFDGPERHTRPGVVDDPAGAELVVAGGSPVVVDRAARTVRRIGPGGGDVARACVDIRGDDDSVRFGAAAGGDRVYAVSGDQGVLRVSDLATGRCASVAVTVAAAGSELGPPVEARGRVFVPDYTTGKVAVVDVDRERIVVTDEPVAEGRFELFVEDGFVFYNDPDSERAGVIHVDGSADRVLKYDPTNPGAGLDNDLAAAPVPPPEQPEPDDAGRDPASAGDPGSSLSPGDTRPARPDEVTVPGGGPGSTTATSSGSTGSTGSTSPTTTSSSTTVVTPTTSCPGPDSDRDGIPDACDPDDDGDGVADTVDICPGFDDRADQDADGTPDGCDSTDGTPPSIAIVDVIDDNPVVGTRTFSVVVHAEDPQTGVARIEVSLSYVRYGTCKPTLELEPVQVGPLTKGADNVSDFTASYRLPKCTNGRPDVSDITFVARARNAQGLTATT